MTGPITRNRDIEALKIAASWPGAGRDTIVTLGTRLAAAGADADGFGYFRQRCEERPGQPLLLALAGFFQARAAADVDSALAKLDTAASADLGLPQYFRGLALASLPPDPKRAAQAADDLEFVLAVRDQFPPAMLRAAHRGLASAYAVLGQDDLAAEASRNSGLGSVPADSRLEFGGFWANADDGFRFTSPRIYRPEPDVAVAQGYDFGDVAFLSTSEGVVAIDAGTTEERVRAAAAAAGLPDGRPVTHLILTHAHFDHVGGAGALLGPATQVIAQAGFPEELERQSRATFPFGYFRGTGTSGKVIVPGRLVAEPVSLTAGGTELVLLPTRGGETPDALMVHLPASGVLFTGDVLMPYIGAPFFAEGSPEGLLEAMRFIRELRPRVLIHGHTPLTELFTAGAIEGLEAALEDLRGQVLDGIHAGQALADILDRNYLPGVLRGHPGAVLPYLVTRDHFTARLYRERTGYWQPDGQGLEPARPAERAAALDLLTAGREEPFVSAAATLIGQGDHALALDIIQPGLLRHPASTELARLRQAALRGLMERYQQGDPFRFLIYAELAGAEIGPVR